MLKGLLFLTQDKNNTKVTNQIEFASIIRNSWNSIKYEARTQNSAVLSTKQYFLDIKFKEHQLALTMC